MKKQLLAFTFFALLIAGNLSAQMTATTSVTNPSCANNNGSSTITPSGGTGYTYKWSNGATTATATGLAAGTYTVTAYSAAGTIWDTLYFEKFEGTHNWTLNTSTGTNGTDPNFWTVSDNEGGVAPPGCGVASNGDNTLHITSVFNPSGGAAYDAGGLCGVLYCPQTAAAASSPNINTQGATNLVLRYDFIGNGQTTLDVGSSQYSINGGTGYVPLDATLRSVNTGCAGQGKWTQRSYNLPANTLGLTNFKVRFNWINNDDGAGTDPSIALNNVLLRDSMPGTADSVVKTVTLILPTGPHFVTSALSVVNPGCNLTNGSINNMGVAGGTPNYTLKWTTSGGAQIGSSNSITNVGPGTYTFEVTDANGCVIDTSITLVTSTGSGAPTISTTKPVICANDSSQICVTTAFTTYLWNTGATSQCIFAKVAGNYYVTVTDNSNCTAESNHIAITVYQLPPVSISVNGDTLTAFGATSYQWYRNGVIINGAMDSTYIVSQGGTYVVVVGDANGCQATSNGVVVSGIEDLKDKVDFVVYPNPLSSGNWNLVAGADLIGSNAEVFDAAGKVVFKTEIKNQRTEINTNQLANGVYLIKINTGKAVRTQKLIKL